MKVAVLAAGACTVVAVASVTWLASARGSQVTAADPAPAQRPPDGTFRPSKAQWEALPMEAVSARDFRSEQVTDGIIATNENTTVNVFSPYSGKVASVTAKVGDRLRKGDPLMTVEASEFVQGQNDLVAALAALNTASTQVRQAEKNEDRQHQLYLAKAGALKDWQQSQADLTAARNTERSAEIALAAVRNRLRILGKSDGEIATLEGQGTGGRMRADAVVAAPIAGTVVQRQVGPGQFIQSAAGGASNPVFAIADLSKVWLVANLRETDAGLVQVGQPVEVRVVAYPQRVFKARITFVSPTVDANTHRIPVRAEIDNRDGALKPQMVATFTIVTGAAAAALSVPRSAVVYDGTQTRVFVAAADGTLRAREVRLGRTSGERVEVLEGLAAGEKVVTGGALFIDRAAKGSQA